MKIRMWERASMNVLRVRSRAWPSLAGDALNREKFPVDSLLVPQAVTCVEVSEDTT